MSVDTARKSACATHFPHSLRWSPLLELLGPIQHHVQLADALVRPLLRPNHYEVLAVGHHVVAPLRDCTEKVPFEQLVRSAGVEDRPRRKIHGHHRASGTSRAERQVKQLPPVPRPRWI